MTTIARDAGVAVGSVYSHFATRRELFLTVLLRRSSGELDDAGTAEPDADGLTTVLGTYQERLRNSSGSAETGALQAEMWLFAMRDDAFREAVAGEQLRRLNPGIVDPASLGRIARVMFLARPGG